MSAKATHEYLEGPFDKPNSRHLVTIVREADIGIGFWVVALPDGQRHVVHRSKLKPVAESTDCSPASTHGTMASVR